MPRIGQNPAKLVTGVHQPARVTLTTVVYIPDLTGFWAESLEVLKLCIGSMAATSAGVEREIVVLDNASCPEVRAYLQEQHELGVIDQLILSRHNLGKVGAWNVLFGAAQGEIIGFTDSDVYFLPGWLEESLKVLAAFPEAGMVTAQPIAGWDLRMTWTSKAALEAQVDYREEGILVSEAFVTAQRDAIGAPEERRLEMDVGRCEVLLARGASRAYTTASHFQFLTRREVVVQLFPAGTAVPLGDAMQFDNEMQALGYWRLATEDYLVHHMGNTVPDLPRELPWVCSDVPDLRGQALAKPARARASVGNPWVRRRLKALYAWTYRALYG